MPFDHDRPRRPEWPFNQSDEGALSLGLQAAGLGRAVGNAAQADSRSNAEESRPSERFYRRLMLGGEGVIWRVMWRNLKLKQLAKGLRRMTDFELATGKLQSQGNS
jgi:hypothetical protein